MHSLDIIPGMAPIAAGIQVAQKELVLPTQGDGRRSPGDFAGHKGLAPHRGFVVEKNAVAGIHVVGLAVVHRNPIRVEFGYPVRRTRVKRGRFGLRNGLNQAV